MRETVRSLINYSLVEVGAGGGAGDYRGDFFGNDMDVRLQILYFRMHATNDTYSLRIDTVVVLGYSTNGGRHGR